MSQNKIFTITLLLFWVACLAAQNPHPHFRNYTTDRGLPSPEVHYCLEDSLGFMWFATDNGLSRFDGYRFKNYGLQEGLKDPVVLFMQLDSKGRIWMATLSGNLYFMENDSIHAFAGNEVIQQINKWHNPNGFFIGKNDELLIEFAGSGLLKFERDGNHELIKAKNRLGGVFLYRTSIGWVKGKTSSPDSLREEYISKYLSKGVLMPLEMHSEMVEIVGGLPMANTGTEGKGWVVQLPDNKILLCVFDHLYEIKDKTIISSRHIDYNAMQKSIALRHDGSILVGVQKNGGLRRYQNLEAWRAEEFEQFLPGKTVSHVFEDSRSGLWIGTVEDGAFHCPNMERKIYDRSAGLPMDYVSAITFGEEHEMFVGLRNGQVLRLDMLTGSLAMLPKIPSHEIIYDLVFDETAKTLWVANGRNAWLNGGHWNAVYHLSSVNKTVDYVLGKRITLRRGSQQLWGGNNSKFGMIDTHRKTIEVNSYDIGIAERTNIVWEAANGKIWVGGPAGLFEFRENQLLRPEPFHPAFAIRVDDIAELTDGSLVIATKGDGLLLWRDTFFQQLTTVDGLTTNMLENLHVDADGRIWAGSLQGLNRITLPNNKTNNPMYVVENFTTWHGLPSNEITMVRSRGSDIWVATTRGLMQWQEPRKDHSIKPPFFENIEVNGISTPFATSTTCSHNENNLSFHYLTLNYDQSGRIPYRYRLNGHKWSNTEERSINFAKLTPGKYRFEVQSQNEDGIWSQSLEHSFTIQKPWWQQWWFSAGVVCGFMAIIWGYYKNQMNALRKEVALQKQLSEMERQALAAQMNPHFIFNCLNSIQRLILDQDSDNALLYLTRFSKLVRGNLHASVEGLITLKEEIEMLKNYLELEKLRFKDAFVYSIEVNGKIDQFEVVLPPLLIQPYVENALIHGLQTKADDGLINIAFSLEGNDLIATVTDNGVGIHHTGKGNIVHKSVGMTLTKRRLELLDGGSSNELVKATEILKGEGKVLGTKVVVRIKQLQ